MEIPTTLSLIKQARERLSERYRQDYHQTAIRRGEWDSGSLIAAELQAIKDGLPAEPINSPDNK